MRGVCSPFERYLHDLHARFEGLCSGNVATYIPELARANPDWFGICIVTVDGRIYEVGDTRQSFTIQSISKPLAYGLALDTHGLGEVATKVGVEPSGEAFNSISLEPGSGRPRNPMINAGAIATTSMVPGTSLDERSENLKAMFGRYLGHPTTIDEAVYQSESITGHRNRAIGHMLRSFGILQEDPHDALELYFRQCSIIVDCKDLAMIGATLAAGGSNPITQERALTKEHVHHVLSVMMSSGMYDFAGSWGHEIGLPAKSGVAGGVLAVLPGQFGIAVFSPRLDEKGNSVRGIEVCRRVSIDWGLHCLKVPGTAHVAVRARYDATTVGSKRGRSAARQRFFDRYGREILVYELQGELLFSGAESVVQQAIVELSAQRHVVLDFKRVLSIDQGAATLFEQLARNPNPSVGRLKFCSVQQLPGFTERLRAAYGSWEDPSVFPDRDLALEWCETRLEAEYEEEAVSVRKCALDGVDVLANLRPDDVAYVERYLVPLRFHAGDLIVRQGDSADRIYLLVEGEVSVTISISQGRLRRLATMQAGMTFGEQALIGGGTRGADIRAETDGCCYQLLASAFEELGQSRPEIQNRLLKNLLIIVSGMLSRTTREIATLAG